MVYGIVICNPSFHRDDRVDRVDGKAGRSSKKRRGGHTHTHIQTFCSIIILDKTCCIRTIHST